MSDRVDCPQPGQWQRRRGSHFSLTLLSARRGFHAPARSGGRKSSSALPATFDFPACPAMGSQLSQAWLTMPHSAMPRPTGRCVPCPDVLRGIHSQVAVAPDRRRVAGLRVVPRRVWRGGGGKHRAAMALAAYLCGSLLLRMARRL